MKIAVIIDCPMMGSDRKGSESNGTDTYFGGYFKYFEKQKKIQLQEIIGLRFRKNLRGCKV